MFSSDDRRSTYLAGLEAYSAGHHHEAHELWEVLWQDEPDLEKSRMLQALIFIASAAHKALHGIAPGGARTLLAQAEARLRTLPNPSLGVDVDSLLASVAAYATELDVRLGESPERAVIDVAPPSLVVVAEVPPWPLVEVEPLVVDGERGATFEAGLAAYREGQFFDAHEHWEHLWRDERDADVKQLLQGLIQVAAAMHKAQVERKLAPASGLLTRALLRLSVLPSHFGGLDLERLVREIRAAQGALAALGDASLDAPMLPVADVPTIVHVLH